MKLKGPSIKLIISQSKGQCALEMEENHGQPMPTYMHMALFLFPPFCHSVLKTWPQTCARCLPGVGRSSLKASIFQIREQRP